MGLLVIGITRIRGRGVFATQFVRDREFGWVLQFAIYAVVVAIMGGIVRLMGFPRDNAPVKKHHDR